MAFRIQINEDELKRNIMRELLAHISTRFQRAANNTVVPVKLMVQEAIINSSTYQQLTPGGRLYNEIGNPDIVQDIKEIVGQILRTIDANIVFIAPYIGNNQIQGEFVINILKSDLSDVLALPNASYTYFSDRYSRDVTVDWLDWVLTKGGQTLVTGFHFVGGFTDISRTGDGLMMPGSSWGLSATYAGSVGDNWFTRELEKIRPGFIE